MKKLIILFAATLVFISSKIKSQTIVTCTTDSIKLNAQNHQFGTLEWEKSYDNTNWEKIPNAHDIVYKFLPSTSAYYRVANKFPYCEPNYSSVTFVQTKPKANAGSDRIANDSYIFLSGNSSVGETISWSILEGIGGFIEQPNKSYTKFSGFSDGNSGSSGNYKLLYTLQNDCGVSTDTLNVKFIQNQYYEKLVVVDNTDNILSTAAQIENGEYIITFNNAVPTIDNQTILIGIVGDGFMRKVDSFSRSGDTFTMLTSQAKIEEVINKGGLEIGQLYNLDSINENLRMSNYQKLDKLPTRSELLSNENLQKGTHYFIVDEHIESPIKSVSYSKGTSFEKGKHYKNDGKSDGGVFITYNFDNTTLYDKNGINATLDGNITFSPNIVGDIDIDWISAQVTKANIGLDNAKLQFHSKLNITATAAGATQPETITLSTIHKTLLLIIAGVPTLIKIKTQLNATLAASATGTINYTSTYDKTYTVSAGIVYDNGAWSQYFNQKQSSSFTDDLTVKGSITESLDIGPKIYFTINGIAGPYVDANMTADLTLCASTQNLQDFNSQTNLDLGAKLTVGIHGYMFKKKLFDKNVTWENRKLFNERTPYLMDYISGNNQQYTVGQSLLNPLKVRLLSKNGFLAKNVLVTFEVLDNSGTLSESQVLTDSNGFAQVIFTPTANTVAKVRAFVRDCDFNYIQYSPIVFTATKKAISTDCSKTTLSASFYKINNTIKPVGHLGVPPYMYSTDEVNFSSTQPIINLVAGQTYKAVIKDANGCVAYTNYFQNTNNCIDSDLKMETSTYGNNAVVSAEGGNPPYVFALDNGAFVSSNTFNNISTGSHLFRVKDNSNCVRQSIINFTNSTNDLIAYFEVPETINAGQPILLNNLSTNATSYSWNFGNGQSSILTNPNVTYNYNGTYVITLTISNGLIENSFSRTIKIFKSNIFNIPTANIPAGTFIMGSPTNEPNRNSGEVQHEVTLSAFRMSIYEITCSQFAAFLNEMGVGTDGKWSSGPYPDQILLNNDVYGLRFSSGQWIPWETYNNNKPMAGVTWYGAMSFAQYSGGQLPTEAQWEYAARGGIQTAFNTGNCLKTSDGNYDWKYPQSGCTNLLNNSGQNTKVVGSFPPNAYGLYDMHGNLREWCFDYYDYDYNILNQTNPTGPSSGYRRVSRGGYWNDPAKGCRSAIRYSSPPQLGGSITGFRIVF